MRRVDFFPILRASALARVVFLAASAAEVVVHALHATLPGVLVEDAVAFGALPFALRIVAVGRAPGERESGEGCSDKSVHGGEC